LSALAVLGVNTTLILIRLLPKRFLPFLGDCLGILGYYLIPKRKKIAEKNIKLVYGDNLSSRKIKALTRAVFRNISRDMIEVGLSFVYSQKKSYWEKNISLQGKEHLDLALKKGKGVIAVSAHLGNFPIISAKLASLGYPFSLIAKDPENIYLAKVFKLWREKLGIGTIPYKPRYRCVTESLKTLRKNGIIMMLIDQNPRKRYGEKIDFFNYQIPTYTGPIVLALRTGAAIIPIFIHRNLDHTETINILPEITINHSENKPQDIIDHLQVINSHCEAWIKKYPEQWWWIHRRFRRAKKKPAEEPTPI